MKPRQISLMVLMTVFTHASTQARDLRQDHTMQENLIVTRALQNKRNPKWLNFEVCYGVENATDNSVVTLEGTCVPVDAAAISAAEIDRANGLIRGEVRRLKRALDSAEKELNAHSEHTNTEARNKKIMAILSGIGIVLLAFAVAAGIPVLMGVASSFWVPFLGISVLAGVFFVGPMAVVSGDLMDSPSEKNASYIAQQKLYEMNSSVRELEALLSKHQSFFDSVNGLNTQSAYKPMSKEQVARNLAQAIKRIKNEYSRSTQIMYP